MWVRFSHLIIVHYSPHNAREPCSPFDPHGTLNFDTLARERDVVWTCGSPANAHMKPFGVRPMIGIDTKQARNVRLSILRSRETRSEEISSDVASCAIRHARFGRVVDFSSLDS